MSSTLHLQISKFSVFPLFPTTIGALVIEEDLSNLEQIKNVKYRSSNSISSTNCFASEDLRILSKFQNEKDIIMSYFNTFKNDVLRFESTDVEMTTSWATKLTTNASSQFHAHKNSYYSGVVYLEKPENGGEIEFESTGLNPSSFKLNSPAEYNLFNFESFDIQPQRNLVVFFPSYLRHRIKHYTGRNPRYSIAFNIVPVGNYGENDSSVNVSINI
jgi:uncharacterized protein (TIGR02466 family)